MYYDLHIHSGLSPCAEDEMTVNNIVNMARLKGLDLIALTDHNSTKQLKTLSVVAKDKINVLYGVEMESKEEVHILGYFKDLNDALALQSWLDLHLNYQENNPDYFGHEYLYDENDQIIGEEKKLLITSLDQDIYQVAEIIRRNKGTVVLAHVANKANSITSQLGFIPSDLDFEGLEVHSLLEKEAIREQNPQLNNKEVFWLFNSDAHRLQDISEADNELSKEAYEGLFGDKS